VYAVDGDSPVTLIGLEAAVAVKHPGDDMA
jgi:hypothetical protein